LPQHLEAEEHVRRPARDGHCGGAALDAADEVADEKLHVVKEHQRRRVVRRTVTAPRHRDDVAGRAGHDRRRWGGRSRASAKHVGT